MLLIFSNAWEYIGDVFIKMKIKSKQKLTINNIRYKFLYFETFNIHSNVLLLKTTVS